LTAPIQQPVEPFAQAVVQDINKLRRWRASPGRLVHRWRCVDLGQSVRDNLWSFPILALLPGYAFSATP